MTSKTLGARVAVGATILLAAGGFTGCSALAEVLGMETATRDAESQEVTEAGNADVFSLRVGDCFDDDSMTGEISDVPVVPCGESHDNEVYYAFEMPAGDWPGDTAIDEAALEQCDPQFATFVGLSYAESTLDWFPITPTQDGWESIGDHEILCAIWDPAGPVSGSLAGVAR